MRPEKGSYILSDSKLYFILYMRYCSCPFSFFFFSLLFLYLALFPIFRLLLSYCNLLFAGLLRCMEKYGFIQMLFNKGNTPLYNYLFILAPQCCCHIIKPLWKGRTGIRKNNEKEPTCLAIFTDTGNYLISINYKCCRHLYILACKKHYTTYVMIVHISSVWCFNKAKW